MLVLPVATACGHKDPTIVLQHAQHLTDLHQSRISDRRSSGKCSAQLAALQGPVGRRLARAFRPMSDELLDRGSMTRCRVEGSRCMMDTTTGREVEPTVAIKVVWHLKVSPLSLYQYTRGRRPRFRRAGRSRQDATKPNPAILFLTYARLRPECRLGTCITYTAHGHNTLVFDPSPCPLPEGEGRKGSPGGRG